MNNGNSEMSGLIDELKNYQENPTEENKDQNGMSGLSKETGEPSDQTIPQSLPEEGKLDEGSTDQQQSSDAKIENEQKVEKDDYDFFADLGFEGVDFEVDENTNLEDLAAVIKENIDKIVKDSGIDDQEVRDFRDFKAAGGTLEEFKAAPQRIDYAAEAEKLNDTNLEVSENIIRFELSNKGLDEEAIDAAINTYKDTGKLVEKAQSVLRAADVANKKEYEDWKTNVEKQTEEYKKEVEQQVSEAKNLINKGVFAGVVLDKEESKQFYNYIFGTDAKINESYKTSTLEQQLFLDYIRFRNYDLNKIKQSEKFTKSKASVRTIGKFIGSGRTGEKPVKKANEVDIDSALGKFFNKQ